jgi:hypothetical protein
LPPTVSPHDAGALARPRYAYPAGRSLTVYQTAELAFFSDPPVYPFPVRLAPSRSGGDARRLPFNAGPAGSDCPCPLHATVCPDAVTAPCRAHSPASMACMEPGPGPLGASSQRPHNKERGEPSVPAHRFHGQSDPPCPTRASDGLDQARMIVLDFANWRAHWPACHFLGRIGCERGFGGVRRSCEPNRPHLGAFLVQPEVRSMCLL